MPPVKKVEVVRTVEQDFELRLHEMFATFGQP